MADPVEVSTEIAASADEVYRLVSDLPRMGEWSPECERCVWLGDATGAAEGARFRGHNRLGWRRWTTTGTVATADPGRELTFDITVGPLAVARWSYRLEPLGERRSRLTESFVDRRHHAIGWLSGVASGVSDRTAHNATGMRETLDRIRAEAERRAEGNES
jgi:hypothetical protein